MLSKDSLEIVKAVIDFWCGASFDLGKGYTEVPADGQYDLQFSVQFCEITKLHNFPPKAGKSNHGVSTKFDKGYLKRASM